MTEQQQRLHSLLDYGGHLIGGLLLAYGGWLWLFSRFRSEIDLGLTLVFWAVGVWVATRLVLYVLSGQIPFVTNQAAQKKVLEVVKKPWFALAVIAAVAAFILAVSWDQRIRRDYYGWRAEVQRVSMESYERCRKEHCKGPGPSLLPNCRCSFFMTATGPPRSVPPANLWDAIKKTLPR